jgi:hypothetical protein
LTWSTGGDALWTFGTPRELPRILDGAAVIPNLISVEEIQATLSETKHVLNGTIVRLECNQFPSIIIL